jgi:hypothetical protein
MNWEALAAIAQIVGSLAVVVTLGYLALQVRQNTKALTTSMYESAMDGFNERLTFSYGDKETAWVVVRGWTEPDALTDKEAILWNGHIRAYTNHLYKLFRLYQRGVFPLDEWERAAEEAAQNFASPGGVKFRGTNHYFDDLWAELDRYSASSFTDLWMGRAHATNSHQARAADVGDGAA